MQVRLKVLEGSNAGKEFKIPTPKCLIGREEGCHIRSQNEAISRRHCVIITTENEVAVRDLKSRNGTYVNDEKVAEEAVLLSGDVLRVGPLQFELLIEHSVSKPKRPKVVDIKEAVARTAEGGAAASTSDIDDVTSWLDEADTAEKNRLTTAPETRQFRLDDTTAPDGGEAGAQSPDTKTITVAPAAAKKPDKKPPGKLPPRPTTSKADSREAAADMLKKFFNRR